MTTRTRARRAPHGKNIAVSLASAALLCTAGSTLAEDSLSDSIERFLQNTQNSIDDTKLWKVHLKPSLRESFIWTDNVFLNAEDEDNVILKRITNNSTGNVITNRDQLEQIEQRIPDFKDTGTEGRVGDYILQTEPTLDFVVPVNENYFKAFGREQMTILGVQVRNQEYMHRQDLDNTSIFLRTDIFGFLSDLLSFEAGNNWWIRVKDDFSRLRDPLDTSIRLQLQDGLGRIKQFKDFERTENTANLDFGYNGGQFDVSAGYENYHLLLEDEDLDQAEHTRHNFHAEVGTQIPWWQQKRVYLRYDYWIYHFSQAPIHGADGSVVNEAQILNDANVQKATLGINGRFFSEKMQGKFEAAYLSWDPKSDGLSGDRNAFDGLLGHAQMAYQPWEERNTKIQLEYEHLIGYSAISNYNSTHIGTLTVLHEIIPKRLDADFTFAFSTTTPSDGPSRKLLETGAGVTYHVFKQFDVTLRYLFRHQIGSNEIVTPSAFARDGRLFEYELRSSGNFHQNILELGFLLHF